MQMDQKLKSKEKRHRSSDRKQIADPANRTLYSLLRPMEPDEGRELKSDPNSPPALFSSIFPGSSPKATTLQ